MNELRQAAFHRAALPEALPASPAERRRAALWRIATFAVIAVVLGIGLTMNPREITSPLVGKPIPEFRLEAVKGRTLGLASADLRGEVSVVNVFASWCRECREEHPLWMELARQRVFLIHGLNYKDRPDEAPAVSLGALARAIPAARRNVQPCRLFVRVVPLRRGRSGLKEQLA